MSQLKHIVLLVIILLSGTVYGFKPTPKKDGHGKGIRLSIGPVVGFYTVNKNHSKAANPKPGAIAGFRKEIRFGRDYRTFFLWGVDYMFHGLSFQSYYFPQDSLKLYDKKFIYKYSLYVQELHLPLQVKYSFKRENNSLFSPYFMIGYHLRYLLPANLKVTQNGKEIIADHPQMKFKNFLGSEQINAFVSASFGYQKNNTAGSKGGFFVELNYRYSFSSYYFQTDYSASSLFINSSHLTLQLGLKF